MNDAPESGGETAEDSQGCKVSSTFAEPTARHPGKAGRTARPGCPGPQAAPPVP